MCWLCGELSPRGADLFEASKEINLSTLALQDRSGEAREMALQGIMITP